MNDLRRHIRELTLTFGLLLGVFAGGADVAAQTPAGTVIRNEAVGRFMYKTGSADSLRSNSAEIVVSPAIAALTSSLVPSRTVVRLNEIVQFTLHYRNSGNGSAYGLMIQDSLPSQVTFVFASRGGQMVGNRVEWNLGTLPAGREDSVIVSVRVRGDLVEPDSVIINRARLWASNAPVIQDSAQVVVHFDPKPGDPLLQVFKTVDLTMARPGMALNYTLQVSNTGEGPATGVSVVDSLPAHTSLVSATNGAFVQGSMVVWRPDTVWVNGVFSAGLVVRINQNCPSGILENSAVISAGNALSMTAGPARTMVSAALAQTLSLRAQPEAVVGNGKDSVQICAEVRDAGGNLVGNGVPVLFSTSRGHFTGSIDTVVGYTTGGIACVFLTSELVAQEIVHATVTATTIGASGLPLRRSVDVLFYPGAVAGIVVSASTGAAVPGVIAQVLDGSHQEVMRDTTGPDGTYLLPLRTSGDYRCELSYTNRYGDVVKVSQRVVVQVPPVGGNPAVSMLGAITGVLVNRGTGQPLRQESIPVSVEQTDQNKTSGGRSMPVSVSTDARGIYVVDSLGMGIYDLRVRAGGYSGALTVPDTVAGAFLVDANIGIADVPSFEIVKSVNKRIAEIGDAVTYALDIRNAGTLLSITNIRVIDHLPSAFVFAANSAYCDGRLLPDPTSRRILEWSLPDTLRPGQTIRIAYMVTLGADALASEGINRAYAAGMTETGDTVRTPEASVQVTVRPGVFTDRGIVIGKVFYDRNGDGYQDEHEKGIGGVELWMEDGTRITTGDDGKYSLPEVIPGQHVIRIYRPSVPTGSSILAPHSEFAGDGISRFVRLTEGGIARADFFLEEPHQVSLTYGLIRTPLDFQEAGALAEYIVHWNDVGKTTSITLRDSLPLQWRFDLSAILLNDTIVTLRNERSRVLQLPLEKKSPGSIDTIWVAVCSDSTQQSIPVMPRAELELTYAKSRPAIIAATVAPTCIARVCPQMTGSCEKVVDDLRRRGTAATTPIAAQRETPGPEPVVLVAPVKPQPESRVDSVANRAPAVAVKTEEAGKPAAPSHQQGTVRRAIKPGKLPVAKPVAPETPSQQNFRMPDLLTPLDGGIMWIAHELLILALVGILVYGVVRRRKREQVENTIQ